MQDWNGCSSLEQDNGSNGDRISITLTDKRDGNTYTVAKLKDGKCWMTQNLRIINSTVSINDTDIQTSTFNIPNISSWDDSFNDARVYSNNNESAYYNWTAATGGQGTYNTLSETTQSICPKSWKLPTKNDYDTLISRYGNKEALKNAPTNFKLLGEVCNAPGISHQNQGAAWHCSTPVSNYCTNCFSIGSSNDAGDNCDRKSCGWFVRCIKR